MDAVLLLTQSVKTLRDAEKIIISIKPIKGSKLNIKNKLLDCMKLSKFVFTLDCNFVITSVIERIVNDSAIEEKSIKTRFKHNM